MGVDAEWDDFLGQFNSSRNIDGDNIHNNPLTHNQPNVNGDAAHLSPEPSPIHISTKTKMAYLVSDIDLSIFWKIPVINYSNLVEGVVKKQIKITSFSQEEVDDINTKLLDCLFHEEQLIRSTTRLKFQHVRKISIGFSKKDIMTHTVNKKQAFFNCFVLVYRHKIGDLLYKEFHIKIFNTGKIEIPGIHDDVLYNKILSKIVDILDMYSTIKIELVPKIDTILINSNFNAGFYINREKLYSILRDKYNLYTSFDPCCSYPGIQCKFYFDSTLDKQTGRPPQTTTTNPDNIHKMYFMIFRTGNVLIGGKINESVLMEGYNFVTNLLKTEYNNIHIEDSAISCPKKINGAQKKKRNVHGQTIIVGC